MHAVPSQPRARASRLLVRSPAGALVVAACGSSSATRAPATCRRDHGPSPDDGPRRDRGPAHPGHRPVVLKVAATANITTWDPVKSFSTEALYMANLYEPLLRVNPPGAAETVHARPRRELGRPAPTA